MSSVHCPKLTKVSLNLKIRTEFRYLYYNCFEEQLLLFIHFVGSLFIYFFGVSVFHSALHVAWDI